MAYAGILDDIRRCVKLEKPDRMPVIALTEEFDVYQSGLTYAEYVVNPQKAASAHIQGVERFNYDWACIYMDDCVEFEPLGVETTGSDHIPRSVKVFLPATYERIQELAIPDPLTQGRMPVLLDTISRIKARFGDSILICGRAPAPFSACTLLYGVQETMMLIYDQPSLLKDTMEFLADLEISFAKAQIEAGAHAIWIGDCSASSRFLSIQHYMDFAFEPAQRLIHEIKKMNAISIYFCAEKDTDHLTASADLPVDIIGLSEDADLNKCKSAVGRKVCLMGNVDPIRLMQNGTADQVHARVSDILMKTSSLGGHLINTGEGVPQSSPVENIEAYAESIRGIWQSMKSGFVS